MIRPAEYGDLPRLYDILEWASRQTHYYPDAEIDEKYAKSLLMQSIQRQGTNCGSTHFMVTTSAGKVEGFMIGILDRIYHVGNRLEANDFYLICSQKAQYKAFEKLVDDYILWAEGNPKVATTKVSWTNALGVRKKWIERFYRRKGFHPIGGIWEKATGN